MSAAEEVTMVVIEHLSRVARETPQRLAFISDTASYTYAELADLVDRIAACLIAQGCSYGAPIAVLSPNDPLAFACVLGVLRAGAAWVPLNQRNSPMANADFLNLAGCQMMLFHGALRHDALSIRDCVPSLRGVIEIDGAGMDDRSLALLLSRLPDRSVEVLDDPERISVIVGTGGTTGAPKAVTWTEATWVALLSAARQTMSSEVFPVHLCVAPMTHAAGILAMMLMPFGATSVTLDRVDPLEIMKRIQEARVTHLYLPPTLLYLMLAHPEVRNFDYSSLRYFLITAAPVAPHRLQEAVEIFGPVMAQCYGQSEAPMLCTFFSPEDIARAAKRNDLTKLASCGRPTSGAHVGVMSASGELLAQGETGEIVVRSALVMRGYLDDPAATAEVSAHGWHHTGDVGHLDEEGFLYIVDRKKDMIISGGFNVFPAEIEKLILTHPAVRECAVIGVPDEKWGEAVKAVVELKPDMEATESEILVLCRASLGGVKTPKSVEFRAQLPRSAVGKVLRRDLRAEYWTGQSRAV
jgi:acyl-CoA synthetase (AMP-forming)/AMP-acid ligase II